MLAEAAWSAQTHHMRWALLYLYKRGLVWEPLGEPPWYSYATASSDWKVSKEIDFRELVSWDTSEGSINRRSSASQKRYFGEKPLAQPFAGSAEEFCELYCWRSSCIHCKHAFIVDPPHDWSLSCKQAPAGVACRYHWLVGIKCIWHNWFLWWYHDRTSSTDLASLHWYSTLFEEHRPCFLVANYEPICSVEAYIACLVYWLKSWLPENYFPLYSMHEF